MAVAPPPDTSTTLTPPSSACAADSTVASAAEACSAPGTAARSGAFAVGASAPSRQLSSTVTDPPNPRARVVACGSHFA